MQHVCKFFQLLFDVKTLEDTGFAMNDSDIANLQDDIIAEDSFAQFYGIGIFSMAGHRVRRNLNRTMGYPKFLDLLNIPEKAAGALKQFRSDCDDYKRIMAQTDTKTKKCAEVLSRHLIHKTSVQQHFLIAESRGWKATHEQAEVSREHGSGLAQSQLIEDIIGHQKNDQCFKNCQ